jgi:hypothetical protein
MRVLAEVPPGSCPRMIGSIVMFIWGASKPTWDQCYRFEIFSGKKWQNIDVFYSKYS